MHRIGAQKHDSIDIRDTIDSRVRIILRQRAGQLADLVQDRRIVAQLLGGAETRARRRTVAA